MNLTKYTPKEIAQRGEEWYEKTIRAQVENEANHGKVLVVDIETGDYEVDTDNLTAVKRLRTRQSAPTIYALRIGFPALGKMGGGWNAAILRHRKRASY